MVKQSVEIPVELQAALRSEPETALYFESLAVSHKREYATWISEAKKDATRTARAAKALEMMRAKMHMS